MFPIRDHNPSLKTPFVTVALIAVNIAVFLATLPAMANPSSVMALYGNWAMIPARIVSGDGWYTLFTSMFMHANLMHLVGNMVFLWIFGDNLEEQLGHIGFLIFYLASGIGADLAHLVSNPLSTVPVVGASGAIAGVMGGYLLLFPRARVDVLVFFGFFVQVFAAPAWMMLGLWFGIQLINGAVSDVTGGGVAYWAHAGGFVVGFLFVLPIWLRRGAARYWQVNEGHPPHPDARYSFSRSHVPKVRRK